MIPVLLHLGPIPIYSFGVMAAMGFLAGNFALSRECQRRGYDAGLADTAPVAAGKDEDARRKNRRIELRLTGG